MAVFKQTRRANKAKKAKSRRKTMKHVMRGGGVCGAFQTCSGGKCYYPNSSWVGTYC